MDSANAIQHVVEEALSHTNGDDYNYETFGHLLANDQVASWVGSRLMSFFARAAAIPEPATTRRRIGVAVGE